MRIKNKEKLADEFEDNKFDKLYKEALEANIFDCLGIDTLEKEAAKIPQKKAEYKPKSAITKHPDFEYWGKYTAWFSLFNHHLEKHFPNYPDEKYNELFTIENFRNCIEERKEFLSNRVKAKEEKIHSTQKDYGIKQLGSNLENPLDLIDPAFMSWFLEIEKKAVNEIKESKIRCAAFCEILYKKGIIAHTKTWQKTVNNFAKSRYGIDINNSLLTAKTQERNKHENQTVNKKPPLRNYFK